MSRLVATTPVHAQVLAALHRPCFDDFWDAAAFAEILAMPGTYGWVAFDDDPAGLVVCRIVADEAEILTIAVLPERRGEGIAGWLLDTALAAAARAGARAMFLEVAQGNSTARTLYGGRGFVEVGRRPRYYHGHTDALILRCDLKSQDLRKRRR